MTIHGPFLSSVDQGDVWLYVLFLTTERQMFLIHTISQVRINLAAREFGGSLRIIAGQGPQSQPVPEQCAREFRALVVDPKIVDSDLASFPYPIGKGLDGRLLCGAFLHFR